MRFEIELHQRPTGDIAEEVVGIARLLTDGWFTDDVPEGTRRDLMFQDLMCLRADGRIASFIVFTSWDGSIYITLIGTHPDHRGRGLGSQLIQHFFEHVKQLGFDRIIALTVPPDVKPSYEPTVKFYEKNGFVLTRRYNELWGSGAIELVKELA